MAGWDWKKEVGPFAAMASVESATVVINTLYEAAILKGLSYFVFIAYSYSIGTLTLLPLPFIFRRSELPPFKMSVLFRIIIAALVGMENLNLRSSTTRFKIVGTMVSTSGALIAVLYKGPTILSSISSSPSPQPFPSLQHPLGTSQTSWIIGGLLLVLQSLFFSIWYILQNQVIEMYPDEQIVSCIYSLCKTVMALPICVVMEAKWSHWTLKPDITLVTIIVSGLFGPTYNSWLSILVLHLKGPLYASIFKPFSIAIAAAFGVIFLGDPLFLGSVLGAAILLFGFYAVIWGKAKEEETKDCGFENLTASPDGMNPLLQSHRVEDMEKRR